MDAETLHIVTRHGVESARQAVNAAVPCFYEDPLFSWVFQDYEEEKRHQRLWTMLPPVFKSAPAAGGFILDAKNWGATMAVSCPGQKFDGLRTIWRAGGMSGTIKSGLKPTLRLLHEFFSKVDRVKSKVIPASNPYNCYYILIAATQPSHRRQGLLRAMMEHVMDLARADLKPIWLEATTSYSRRQFERMGFELVGEIRLGEGKVKSDGTKEKGGEGVVVAGMVWWPEGLRGTRGRA